MTKPPGVSDKDVKDMSPSFKGQYGDRWKKVMYATLWKRHSQEEDTRFAMINYIWENVHPSRKVEENQAILVSHPEEGRQARPLVEMSNNELEHHYMNIRKILGEDEKLTIQEDGSFAFVNRKGVIRKTQDHMSKHRRDGWEAYEKGKSSAANPHVAGTKHAHAWKQGYEGSKQYHEETVHEGEHQERTKAYQKDKSFSMKPDGDDFSMVGNDSGYVYKTHSNKTLMRQHVDDQNNLKNPPKSKMVINKKIEGEPKNKVSIAQQKLGHLMGKAMFPVKEDAVDDQLAKHGLSRLKLQHTMQTQGQQHQGLRPTPSQHPNHKRNIAQRALSGIKEKWDTNYETPESKKGMFKGRSLSSLEKQDKNASGTKKKQVDFAIRAKKHWKGGV